MLRLLLPVIVPSWRFFDVIGPAPRTEIAWLLGPTAAPDWRPLVPRPARLDLTTTLRRLVWNPEGNAALYVSSLAERLLDAPSAPAGDAFLNAVIELAVGRERPASPAVEWLQVRIVSTRRDGAQLVDEVAFLSSPLPVAPANAHELRAHPPS